MTSSDSTVQVALPNLDSEPRVVVEGTSDQASDNQSSTGTSGQVAGSSSEGLPNTGPTDAMIPAAVLGLLVWQVASYRRSRQDLKQSLI